MISPTLGSIAYINETGEAKDYFNTQLALLNEIKDFECIVCMDLYEKLLLVRCCEVSLCVICYTQIESPKKCPSCRKVIPEDPVEGLKTPSRHIPNIINRAIKKHTIEPKLSNQYPKDNWDLQKNCINKIQGKEEQDNNPVANASYSPRQQVNNPYTDELYLAEHKNDFILNEYYPFFPNIVSSPTQGNTRQNQFSSSYNFNRGLNNITTE